MIFNRTKLKIVFVLFFLLILFCCKCTFSNVVYADNSYITIVNPVRISDYTKDSNTSVQTEYNELQKRELPATWLLTYDVLSHQDMISTFSQMNNRQELGVFLEVTESFCQSAHVSYNKTNSWHRATSLFLSGYSDEDRKKLIDAVFSKFKKTFGYYPKSVGGWWVDSFSLSYMKGKYNITGVLGVSDQYDLDGYQIWGTPWSPYYPNKINAAIPAADMQDKLDVVTFKWAPRDPLNGYLSPGKNQSSLYSTQDYARVNLSPDYFGKLIKTYTNSDLDQFGQLTLGLEADYSPDIYSGIYSNWLNYVIGFESHGVIVTNMNEFAHWYRNRFPELSPNQTIYTDDILGSQKKILWFTTSLYRIGLVFDNKTNKTSILDFRVYPKNLIEPFYSEPNKQYNLSINLPFVVDSVISKKTTWSFDLGKVESVLKNNSEIQINLEKGKIILGNKFISFPAKMIPDFVKNSVQLSYEIKNGNSYIYPKENFNVDKNGLLIHDYTLRVPFTIQYRIERFKIIISLILFPLLLLLIKFLMKKRKWMIFIGSFLLLSFVGYIIMQSKNQYFISQTEYDAISVLSNFPKGKVLIYDRNCLKCTFELPFKPAAAAGRKGYIGHYSKQPIIFDISFSTAKNSKLARLILKDEDIKYVYLTKYESFVESLPYTPEDLGLRKVYENGNAAIWEVF